MPVLAKQKPLAAPQPAASVFAADILQGLRATPKRIAPKYFYDSEGSRLFEEITRLPEYYPTRSELAILRAHAKDIAALIPDGAALVEFGSGATTKAQILIEAAPQLAAYVPVDISADYLRREVAALNGRRGKCPVYPVAADFTQSFSLPRRIAGFPRAGFFPGSTIGNFEPAEAAEFLRHAGRILGGRGAVLIIGVDLVKDIAILEAAYNDASGVTRKFNLNVLARINRELAADFDLSKFEHRAFYNRQRDRIEMHLVARAAHTVKVAGAAIAFRAGESIHTENSYKYSPASFRALSREAGWNPVGSWTDLQGHFTIHALILN